MALDSDDAKLELYNFVKDIYDKLISARQGQKTRLSIFLVLTGLLSTAIFTFAMPSVLTSFDYAATLPEGSRYTGSIIAAEPLIALIPLAVFLIFALWSIVEGLELISVGVTDMTHEIAMPAMHMSLDPTHTLVSLMGNYFEAIDRNYTENQNVGRCMHSVVSWLKLAIVSAFFLLLLVPISRYQLKYCIDTNSVADSKVVPMTNPAQSNQPSQPPTSDNQPQAVQTAQPVVMPTPPSGVGDARPNLTVPPRMITESYDPTRK